LAEVKKSFPAHTETPSEQRDIHARCYHSSGAFTEFRDEDLDQSIPDRFEAVVRMHPDRLAIKVESATLTYAELNANANRMARAILAERGSGTEPVALMLEKGAPLFTAMMAVLKAGKFFIPLDPSMPASRIAAGLEDLQTKLLITNRQNSALSKDLAGQITRIVEVESVHGGHSTENLGIPVAPEAIAYIIYTSGSTGQPKGVIQNHRNLLYHVMIRAYACHICEHDRLAHLTSGTGTGNATSNAFVPLLQGAAFVSFDVRAQGVSRLANWLVRERISICPISSPLFRNFAGTLTGMEQFSDLRVVRLSSDAVYQSDLNLFKRYFPASCILATGLSSTETGSVTSYLMDHTSEIPINQAPLGYPLEGKEVLLLDEHDKEVALGEIGEIAVNSRYLSPGYWRRPELSNSKFLSDPTGGDKRLYLSGDLGLMLADGCLVYKGRKDFRVKVRGYGVEFAEVEKALLEYSGVKEALVTTRQNAAGEAELVAYLTSKHGRLTVSELRAFLVKKLPHFMIPAAYMILDAMPIALNGKIDRSALPTGGRARPELENPLIPPRNAVEEELTNMWAEVLCIDPVGIHDRFLDLGGTSLSATRVLSRVFKTYQLELTIESLLQSPTIAEMAQVIAQGQAKKLDERDLARILADLESLSDDQARQLLGKLEPTDDSRETKKSALSRMKNGS
jgi:amino acid adenylation domain-containing protein